MTSKKKRVAISLLGAVSGAAILSGASFAAEDNYIECKKLENDAGVRHGCFEEFNLNPARRNTAPGPTPTTQSYSS